MTFLSIGPRLSLGLMNQKVSLGVLLSKLFLVNLRRKKAFKGIIYVHWTLEHKTLSSFFFSINAHTLEMTALHNSMEIYRILIKQSQ